MVNKAGTRRKKTEKSKTQLKRTIQVVEKKKNKKSFKLKKGLNEADLIVNAKSLNVPTQLRSVNPEISGPLTRRNIPLKDCLIKLKHYSLTGRLTGLEGLHEILSDHPQSAREHLSTLVSKVSPLLIDPEEKVRKECSRIISRIVSSVELYMIQPLFPVLSAHLCSALSHVRVDIQKTALEALDDLFNLVPDFVVGSYKQILPNFLEQISTKGENGRRLSNRIDNEELTILQWRTEVLKRLSSIFKLIALKERRNPQFCSRSPKSVYFDDLNPFISKCYSTTTDEESLSLDNLDHDYVKRAKNSLSESFKFEEFFKNLVPLLLETWKETSHVGGRKNKSSPDMISLFPSENAEILEVVVDILKSMLDILKISLNDDDLMVFKRDYGKEVSAIIIQGFPFSFVPIVSKKRVLITPNPESINCKTALIYVEGQEDLKEKVIKNIIDYCLGMSKTRRSIGNDSYYLVMKRLSEFIFEQNLFPTLLKDFDSLLQTCIDSRPKETRFFNLMSDLSIVKSYRERSYSLKEWIKTLPMRMIHTSRDSGIISAIHQLQKQNNELLLESFSINMDTILDELKNTKTVDSEEKLKMLFTISYRLRTHYPKLEETIDLEWSCPHIKNFCVNLNSALLVS